MQALVTSEVRSRPSAEMVLHLSERLGVPLRERNRLVEVTASELSIESFVPADRATEEAVRAASVAPSHADR